MEFSVGGPKWESIAASEERREKELKAAESITWATSHTEVEEAAIEEAMATVAAREAEAAPAVDVRAIWSENANAWVQNESASAAAAAALPLPTEAIPAVTVAAVAATAATKWRRRERHLRQAQLQLYLDRRQLVKKGGWLMCPRALGAYSCTCTCMDAYLRPAGSGMSALRRGDQTMARLLEDSAKRRPHGARVDAEVETALSLCPNL